ncbi:MAG: MBL fold metallo-hydrolase [Steroidobacteraceae bacterium]
MQVADGVHVIRHADAPDGYPQGNTTVVIGARGVLVVDSCYLPSSAAEDIAQIRRWTNRPVLYLLNTHWHPDHVRGNQQYLKAFPQLSIIANRNTAILMATYESGNLHRRPARLAALRTQADSGRNAAGDALSAAEIAELRTVLAGSAVVDADLSASYAMVLPNLTFDDALDIDLGGRRVQIRHSGAGDTQGDAWLFLPDERILVVGDLIVHPLPFFLAGYPKGFANTLRIVSALDPKTIVPGHGAVQHDQAHIRSLIELIDTVNAAVDLEVAREGSLSAKLESVRKTIDVSRYRQQFAGDQPDDQEAFDESIDGLIRNAFNQAPK